MKLNERVPTLQGNRKQGYIMLLSYTNQVLKTSINIDQRGREQEGKVMPSGIRNSSPSLQFK
jgi:hypothetical protein